MTGLQAGAAGFCEAKDGRISFQAGFSRPSKSVLMKSKPVQTFVNSPIYRAVFQTCFCNAKAGPILNNRCKGNSLCIGFLPGFATQNRAQTIQSRFSATSIPAFATQKQVHTPEMLEVSDFKFFGHSGNLKSETSSISGRPASGASLQTCFCFAKAGPNPFQCVLSRARTPNRFLQRKNRSKPPMFELFDANAFPATPGMSCQKVRT